MLVAFIASLGLEMRRRAEPSGEVRNLGVLAGPSKEDFSQGRGVTGATYVPRGVGGGAVRADKAGEAFTRQPWWWERRADAEAGQQQQQQFVLFVEAGRAYLPYGKPPSVRARSRARRGAAPRRHRRPTYLLAPSLAAVGARA